MAISAGLGDAQFAQMDAAFSIWGLLGVEDKAAIASIKNFANECGKTAATAIEAFKKVNSALSGIPERVIKVASAFKAVNVGLNSFVRGLATSELSKFTHEVTEAHEHMEVYQRQLVGLTGSTEAAEEAWKNLTKAALKSPFPIDDYLKASIELKKIKEHMKGVTDEASLMHTIKLVSAVSNKSLTDVSSTLSNMLNNTNHYGVRQLLKEMKVSPDEFIAYGAKPSRSLSGGTGGIEVGGQEANKRNLIALEAVAKARGGEKILEEKSKSLGVVLAHMHDQWELLADVIGEKAVPIIALMGEKFGQLAERLRDINPKFVAVFASVLGLSGGLAIVAAGAAKFIEIVGALSEPVVAVVEALSGIATAAITPELLLVGAIITGLIIDFKLFGDTVENSWKKLFPATKDDYMSFFKEIADRIKLTGQGIKEAATAINGWATSIHKWINSIQIPPRVLAAMETLKALASGQVSFLHPSKLISYYNAKLKQNALANPGADDLPRSGTDAKKEEDFHVDSAEEKKSKEMQAWQNRADVIAGRKELQKLTGGVVDVRMDDGAPEKKSAFSLSNSDIDRQKKELQFKRSQGFIDGCSYARELHKIQLEQLVSTDQREGKEQRLLALAREELEANRAIIKERERHLSLDEEILKSGGSLGMNKGIGLTPQKQREFLDRKEKLLAPGILTGNVKDMEEAVKIEAQKRDIDTRMEEMHRQDAAKILGIDQGITAEKLAELDKQKRDMLLAGHDAVMVERMILDQKRKIWVEEKMARVNAAKEAQDMISHIQMTQISQQQSLAEHLQKQGYKEEASKTLDKLGRDQLKQTLQDLENDAQTKISKNRAELASDHISPARRAELERQNRLIRTGTDYEEKGAKQKTSFEEEDRERERKHQQRLLDMKSDEIRLKDLDIARADLAKRMEETAAGSGSLNVNANILATQQIDLLQRQVKLHEDILTKKEEEIQATLKGQEYENAHHELEQERLQARQKNIDDALALYDQQAGSAKKTHEDMQARDAAAGPKIYKSYDEMAAAQAAEDKASSDAFEKRREDNDRAVALRRFQNMFDPKGTLSHAAIDKIVKSGIDLRHVDTKEDFMKLAAKADDKLKGGIKIHGAAELVIKLEYPGGGAQQSRATIPMRKSATLPSPI